MTKSMTEGNPARLIFFFMLPLFAGNLLQQVYNMADTLIVSRTLGTNALAAVGSTGSVMFLILGFANGITLGVTMITAQRFGAEDFSAVRKSFAAGIMISASVSVVLTAVMTPLTGTVLRLMKTPDEIFKDSQSFLMLIFIAIPASIAYNLSASVLRAVGDSKTPLFFLSGACLVNIGLDFLFILAFRWGVAGAGIATLLAQLLSGVCCFIYIFKKMPLLRIKFSDFKEAIPELLPHLRLGLPMGFQMSIIAVGSIAVTVAVNTLGTDAIAGYTAMQKISPLVTLPLMSFGATMGTYAAQNYGAGKMKRIKDGMIQCAGMSLAVCVIGGLLFWFSGYGMSLFFADNSAEVARLAHMGLKVESVTFVFLSLLFIFRYILQGMGHSLIPTVAGVSELIMRVAAAVILAPKWGIFGVFLAEPMAWFGALVPLGAACIITVTRLLRRERRYAVISD